MVTPQLIIPIEIVSATSGIFGGRQDTPTGSRGNVSGFCLVNRHDFHDGVLLCL